MRRWNTSCVVLTLGVSWSALVIAVCHKMTTNTTAVLVCLAAIPTENFNSVLRVFFYIYDYIFHVWSRSQDLFTKRAYKIKCVLCLVLIESIFLCVCVDRKAFWFECHWHYFLYWRVYKTNTEKMLVNKVTTGITFTLSSILQFRIFPTFFCLLI